MTHHSQDAVEKARDEALVEVERLHVKLTERDAAFGTAQTEIDRLTKDRDEALAELNKALETLGQLRSDLQKAEEARDAALDLIGRAILNMPSGKPEDGGLRQLPINEGVAKLRVRAQSAEASIAKLREAAGDAWSIIHNLVDARGIRGPATDSLEEKALNVARILGSLLDEPDKDQNNAKR